MLGRNSLRQLKDLESKEYENKKMVEAIESNSTDRNAFWRHLKKCRKPSGSKILAIKDGCDSMVYEVSEILEVWRNHYSSLSTPKDDISYDSAHFDTVNKEVNELNKRDDNSPFLETPFTTNEVQRAVNRLKSNKACGYDRICAEHVKYGGYMLTITLTMMFNLINQWEYVPLNFKHGIQVPLFKGKNLCSADTNNYRGITLLSIFSKVYEMIIWARLEPW